MVMVDYVEPTSPNLLYFRGQTVNVSCDHRKVGGGDGRTNLASNLNSNLIQFSVAIVDAEKGTIIDIKSK